MGKNSLSIQQCVVFLPTASSLLDFICVSSCIAQNIPIRYFCLFWPEDNIYEAEPRNIVSLLALLPLLNDT